jgi:hypothetical protein
MYSSEGRQLMAMAASDNGDMSLTLYDPNSGLARAGLGLAADGSPALVMFDKQGKERAELSLDRNAKPSLLVADQNGKTVTALPELEQASRSGGQ